MPRRVGILGGMGPQATVLLMSKVIAAVPAADDRDHVPLLVDQNPQVPSRIARLIEGTGEDPAPVLVAMARRLEAAGAEALAMPCNTAHHFAPAIAAAVGVPFLDMTALSVAHAARLAGPGGRIGVLASPALRRIGLFDGKLARAGLTAVYPEDEDALLGAIRRIKALGADAVARDSFHRASLQLLEAGVTTQMIACTEFSLIADSAAEGARAFDTLDVLVSAIVDFALARDA
ncbi:aspartate/glutamate racemase family protein [Ancylobacter rudongensis]|uniref:Aspartate racemase n=1 Tax=Ancylobacter rudongensis TaxID=177413 RepID=A0A1G4PBJ7_9HYPH|nr:amino acid racemase [Ancylobacter rudongensis]SCW29508.1 aspartate racemase [Ancylobacter rudongensis]